MTIFETARFSPIGTRVPLCTLALALMTTAHAVAQGKPAPPPTPVTSTVHNQDSTGTQVLLLRSDGIDSAQYSTDGTGVVSQIYSSSGDWEIDLTNQINRMVYLTFSDGWNAAGAGSRPPDGYYNARVLSRCFDATTNTTGFLKIVPGTSNNRCSLRVMFSYGNTQYASVMSPLYTGTGWTTVACNAGNASNACIAWTIVPNTTTAASAGNNATVANLYSISKSGKETLVGSAHNTYRIDVTNP